MRLKETLRFHPELQCTVGQRIDQKKFEPLHTPAVPYSYFFPSGIG